ncbi:DUF2508 family protein [Proteinivorax tanatarense]|uniref:DUF2508 family protein n=1 Tax=Proteinivorax tanatarense TaxID=1260629 RepID=A0AAU7VLK4_9FIRM
MKIKVLLKKTKDYFLDDGNQVDVPKSKSALQLTEEAKREWQCAKEYFNSVTDPDLVDYAIHSIAAAEKRYQYLLKQAKEKQNNKYILNNNE